MAGRRRPLDMLGTMDEPGDTDVTGMPMGADMGAVGAPAEGDPTELGALGAPELGAPAEPGLEGGMGEMGMDPEEDEIAQLEAMLADPNTPPEVRAEIEAMLAMASRRSLAGGGAGGLGAI